MAQADSDRLVQYIFPTERLPAHTQELLKEPQGLGRRVLDTWPQYRGRIRQDAAGRPQVYLNLFEYFMFWTAFYVLRGSSTEGNRSDPRTPTGSSTSAMMYGMGGIRSVGSAIVGNLIMGRANGTLTGHPYYRLLKTYLEYFLPRSSGSTSGASGANGGAAARGNPAAAAAAAAAAAPDGVPGLGGLAYGLGLAEAASVGTAGWASYKPTLTAAAAGPDSRGAVLLSILVEFWLTDPSEPLPSLAADRVSGVVQPGGAAGVAPLGGLGLGAVSGGVGGGAAGGGFTGVAGSPGGMAGLAGGAPPTPVAVTMPATVRMLTYQPPSAELIEGLVAMVRYVHVIEKDSMAAEAAAAAGVTTGGIRAPGSGGGPAPTAGRSPVGSTSRSGAHGGSYGAPTGPLQPALVGCPAWLPETPVKTPPPPSPRVLMPPTVLLVHGNSASAAVQAVSRKVYRQLRRAFSQWPPSSPSSLTPLITLWLSILAPWCPPYAHTRKSVAVDAAGAAGASAAGPGGGAAAAGAATPGAGGHPNHHPGSNHRHNHHYGLDGASALGSAAAAAAAGVMEATAAKLQLGGALGRDRDRDMAGATSRELLSQYKYTPTWRSHVLAHLPFYFILLPQFASLTLSRLKYRPDVALRDLDRVLAVLAAAGPELLRELQTAEAVYNQFARPPAAGGRRRSEGEFGEMVPWWLEQAHDFEAAAAAGSSPPAAVQPDVAARLFTTDDAGAAYTTCLLLRNAEMLCRPELVAALRQSAGAVLPLTSILPAAVAEQPRAGEGAVNAADGRRFPRAGRLSALVQENPKLADPHQLWAYLYCGRDHRHDPMLRPIASNEVALLVRPLVRTSVRINRALGLDVPYRPGEEEDNPPEHLGQQALLWARKRGYRINLRFLAEIQTLLWLLGLALLLYAISKAFSDGGGGSGGTAGHAGSSAGSARGIYTGGVSGGGSGVSSRTGGYSMGGVGPHDVYRRPPHFHPTAAQQQQYSYRAPGGDGGIHVGGSGEGVSLGAEGGVGAEGGMGAAAGHDPYGVDLGSEQGGVGGYTHDPSSYDSAYEWHYQQQEVVEVGFEEVVDAGSGYQFSAR